MCVRVCRDCASCLVNTHSACVCCYLTAEGQETQKPQRSRQSSSRTRCSQGFGACQAASRAAREGSSRAAAGAAGHWSSAALQQTVQQFFWSCRGIATEPGWRGGDGSSSAGGVISSCCRAIAAFQGLTGCKQPGLYLVCGLNYKACRQAGLLQACGMVVSVAGAPVVQYSVIACLAAGVSWCAWLHAFEG